MSHFSASNVVSVTVLVKIGVVKYRVVKISTFLISVTVLIIEYARRHKSDTGNSGRGSNDGKSSAKKYLLNNGNGFFKNYKDQFISFPCVFFLGFK